MNIEKNGFYLFLQNFFKNKSKFLKVFEEAAKWFILIYHLNEFLSDPFKDGSY